MSAYILMLRFLKDGGYCLSIETTMSDAIVHSLLWSTAIRSCPLGYYDSITEAVDCPLKEWEQIHLWNDPDYTS